MPLVVLAAVGLAAADFASYRALHNYLYDRVDQQLESAVAPVTAFLTAGRAGDAQQSSRSVRAAKAPSAGEGGGAEGEPRRPAGGRPRGHLPTSAYGQLRSADGEVITHTKSDFFGEEVPTP